MLSLEVLSATEKTGNYTTRSIVLNPSAIVSLHPSDVRFLIKEVDGKKANDVQLTDIVYNTGTTSQRITVVGDYNEITRRMVGHSRKLLHG